MVYNGSGFIRCFFFFEVSDCNISEKDGVISSSPVSDLRPNVILITDDTLRADYLSAYRAVARPTPALDALARYGVLFEQAFGLASWTLRP